MLGDALAIFRLISAGVFDRYPTVRFMFCQLGGCAPFTAVDGTTTCGTPRAGKPAGPPGC